MIGVVFYSSYCLNVTLEDEIDKERRKENEYELRKADAVFKGPKRNSRVKQ